jgi:hypothetical protein
MYPLLGGNIAGCKFNAINPIDTDAAFRITYSGSMVFNASGQTTTGVNGVGTTYINQTTAPTLRGMGILTLTLSTTDGGDIQNVDGSTYLFSSASGGSPRRALVQFGGGGAAIIDPSDGKGFYYGLFTGSTPDGLRLYKNGSLGGIRAFVGSTSFGTNNLLMPNVSTAQQSFGIYTTTLNETEITNLSSIINTWATSIGRNT